MTRFTASDHRDLAGRPEIPACETALSDARYEAPGKLSSSPTTKVVRAVPPLSFCCHFGVFLGFGAFFSARRSRARSTCPLQSHRRR